MMTGYLYVVLKAHSSKIHVGFILPTFSLNRYSNIYVVAIFSETSNVILILYIIQMLYTVHILLLYVDWPLPWHCTFIIQSVYCF